jgi:hypothetical protein
MGSGEDQRSGPLRRTRELPIAKGVGFRMLAFSVHVRQALVRKRDEPFSRPDAQRLEEEAKEARKEIVDVKKGLRTKPNIADFNSKLIEFNTVLKSKVCSRPVSVSATGTVMGGGWCHQHAPSGGYAQTVLRLVIY